MFKKEIFRNRVLQLEKNNKILAAAAGVSPPTMSKYLNLDRTNIPTADVLFNIADVYGVSVDWLIGKTDNRLINYSLKPADACRALVSICESFPEVQLTKFEKTEKCFDDMETPGRIIGEEKTNSYISISFPAWSETPTSSDLRYAIEYGNCLQDNNRINNFLLGYASIRNAKAESDFVTPEQYSQILDKQLKEMKMLDERIERFEKRLSERTNNK